MKGLTIPEELAERLNIDVHPGWFGTFTRDESPHAIHKNGARVRKAVHEPGDATPIGEVGTVLGSIYLPSHGPGYFVEWANRPRVAVFVVAVKVVAACR